LVPVPRLTGIREDLLTGEIVVRDYLHRRQSAWVALKRSNAPLPCLSASSSMT